MLKLFSKKKVPLDDSIEIREGVLENGRWVVNKNANGTQYGAVIRGEGKFEITFELVYDPISKEKYTLAHFTDDLNAYINPYDQTVLPNSVQVSVNPNSIPADGVTQANVIVQLKDKKGRDAAKDGVEVNLTTTNATLSSTKLITAKGRNSTVITSDLVGTIVITASSPVLNSGSSSLTITQAPKVIEFKQWINDSNPQSRQFTTNQELKYNILLLGKGTSCWNFIDEWPNARIEINGTLIGEKTIDSASITTKTYPQTTLPAGTHTLSAKMTNDWVWPYICDRNLYVESVTLSE